MSESLQQFVQQQQAAAQQEELLKSRSAAAMGAVLEEEEEEIDDFVVAPPKPKPRAGIFTSRQLRSGDDRAAGAEFQKSASAGGDVHGPLLCRWVVAVRRSFGSGPGAIPAAPRLRKKVRPEGASHNCSKRRDVVPYLQHFGRRPHVRDAP